MENRAGDRPPARNELCSIADGTFHYGGQNLMAWAVGKGNVILLKEVADMFWLEGLARNAAVSMGAGGGQQAHRYRWSSCAGPPPRAR
jgi:hypothetical protein